MAKRRFRPEDALRIKTVTEPDLSPDGRRVAFVLATVDEEEDRLRSAIWVAGSDGSDPPRPFSEGPADRSPRWSPDGRSLAYISAPVDAPLRAHLRLAPLDGGVPRPVGDLPGPVLQYAWSPDSRRLLVACRVGVPDREKASARDRNAARRVRGLAARLDGIGWLDGRTHLFVVDAADGSFRQLTKGDYDHADPAWSPDGDRIAFVSDRATGRDDHHFRTDVWLLPVAGGRPRRLTGGRGRAAAPTFSPDGSVVAFVGQLDQSWDGDAHAFTVDVDGGADPEPIAPDTDRPVLAAPGASPPLRWLGPQELALVVMDRGGFVLHRARVGATSSRAVTSIDLQVDGLAVQPGGRGARLAYTACWLDRPSELYVTAPGGGSPRQLTHFNDQLLAEVDLAAPRRHTVSRPDGVEIEYFELLPPGAAGRRLPLHLDVHGGPHGSWPSGRFLAGHQSLAAAGYAVILPNPRGSTGYGQAFTRACTRDWGGADCADILASCDDAVRRGVADGSRMFMSGGSYGGFMAAWIAGHTDRFRAATAVAAVIDMNSMLASDMPEFVLFSMGGTPWARSDEYAKRSPFTYLADVQTPMLILHWEGDIRVPVGQADELYAGLRLLGKEAELVRYPGGFHIMRTPSQSVDWCRQILGWNAGHDRRRRG